MANVSLRKTPNLLSVLPKRFASTAPQSQAHKETKRALLPKEPIKVTKLDNGITVASLENHSPVTRIAAVVKAGARDELHTQRGAAHALRVYSSLATRNYSVFGVSRNLNQIGAELSVNSTRESTTYLLESTRANVARGVDILGEVISTPELRHWEIHDAEPRLKFDLDVYDESPELRLNDLIHRASFRTGLSNSLYAPRFNLENLHSETLQEFRRRTFTANRLALVGVGISHEDLIRHAQFFRLPSAAADFARQPAKFAGSELREETLSDLVHLAIATEGVSLASKDMFASAIAAHALGTGPRVKYSANSGRVARAALPAAKNPALLSTFNSLYTDTGLFGFHIIANKSDAGKVAKAVFSEVGKISKNGLTSQEIANAKNALKTSLAFSFENSQYLIDGIAISPENANVYANVNELFKAVDAVSANDVNAFVKRVASGKTSLAAIGDLSELPRLDELNSA